MPEAYNTVRTWDLMKERYRGVRTPTDRAYLAGMVHVWSTLFNERHEQTMLRLREETQLSTSKPPRWG